MCIVNNKAPEAIAKKLNIPLKPVQEYLAQFDEDKWDYYDRAEDW